MPVNATPRTAAYDFKIYSASIDVMEETDILTMKSVSSSTIEDLQGDAMEITALQDMERAPDNQNVLLNHEQRIPEDLMGGLISSKIVLEKGIADLHDVFEVDQVNPRAMMAYQQGKRRRLGISIGGIVKDYHIENNAKGLPICRIDHIELLERSVVGIPAVQRAWVENAAIGQFRRSYDPALAPIVKSMWPQPYADIIANMEDPDQREYFTKGIVARDMGKQRIVWYPAQKQFSIETPNATRPAFVTRGEVAKMLSFPDDAPALPALDAPQEKSLGDVDMLTKTLPDATEDEVVIPSATDATPPTEAAHTEEVVQTTETGGADTVVITTDHTTTANTESATDLELKTPPAVSDSAVKALTVPTTPAIANDDPAYMAWKSMGEQLGYLQKATAPDMQQVTTLVSRLDTITDGMMNSGMYDLAMTADALMILLGIPDYDVANSDMGMGMWSADKIDALRKNIATKAGAAHSSTTMQGVQAAHHILCSIFGASMCKDYLHPNDAATSDAPDSPIDADPSDTARGTLPGQQMNLGYDLTPVTSQLEAVSKALGGIDVSVIGANVQKAIEAQLGDATAVLATLTKGIGEARKELTDARAEIAALTNTPLGRPTTLNRTVQAGEPVATYEDFAAIGKSDIAGTRLVKAEGRGLMRLWSVTATERPELAPWQDRLMSEGEIAAYKGGRECLVPEKE
jgi:phage head maturation protease